MDKLLTAISNICYAVCYTININWSRCVQSIVVESMCARKHLSQLSIYRREKNGSCLCFFSRILHFCTRFHPLHLRCCTYAWKCNEFPWWIFVPILGIAGLYVFRSSDSALLHIPRQLFKHIYSGEMSRAEYARECLAFLTELINCIKRTRSTTLRVRFSLLRIRINYSGTI